MSALCCSGHRFDVCGEGTFCAVDEHNVYDVQVVFKPLKRLCQCEMLDGR